MADKAAIQAERDLQADISQAVRETEEEIFADALGVDEPERDDTSLEEQTDGLEGDETIEDDIDEEPSEQQAEEPEEPAAEADPRDDQIAELRAQIQALSQRVNPQPQPPPQQFQQFQPQQPPPQQPQQQIDPYRNPFDSVLEPEKHYQYSIAAMQQIAAQTQWVNEQNRINSFMEVTRQGPRGTEFQHAYDQLLKLPPEQRLPIANTLRYSNHPGEALLDWWDKTPEAQAFAEAEEARMTQFLEQRGYQVRPSGGRQQAPARQAAPRGRIPPSLNAITGGRSHRAPDADNRLMTGDQVDGLSLGDDSAIFANVWRS